MAPGAPIIAEGANSTPRSTAVPLSWTTYRGINSEVPPNATDPTAHA
jgi:hypothetical protein